MEALRRLQLLSPAGLVLRPAVEVDARVWGGAGGRGEVQGAAAALARGVATAALLGPQVQQLFKVQQLAEEVEVFTHAQPHSTAENNARSSTAIKATHLHTGLSKISKYTKKGRARTSSASQLIDREEIQCLAVKVPFSEPVKHYHRVEESREAAWTLKM